MKKLCKKLLSLVILMVSITCLVACNKNPLQEAKTYIVNGLKTEVVEDLNFVTEYLGVTIEYKSSNPNIISNDGKVTRGVKDEMVTIVVIFDYQGEIDTYDYLAVVRALEKVDPQEKINLAKTYVASLIPTTVFLDLEFVYNYQGVEISYSSSNRNVLSDSGIVTKQTVDTEVVLTINFNYLDTTDSYIVYLVVSAREKELEDYINDIKEDVIETLGITNNVVTKDLSLKTSSLYDSVISWTTSNENLISLNGKVANNVNGEKVELSFSIEYKGSQYEGETLELIINTKQLSYYSNVVATSGDALKRELRNVIKTTHKRTLTYNDLRVYTALTDADPNNPNNIILFYSRKSVSSKWDGGATWNREHVWPQSKGWFTTSGAGADIHHLRPTNPSINSSRGNKAYGEVTNNNTYEPTDEVKGDVARIIFYLLVRYSEADGYKITATATSMELLLEWNKLDPVDDLERTRNEEAFKLQGNRNPFIDNYLYADMIWSSTLNLSLDDWTVTGIYVENIEYIITLDELKKGHITLF